MGRLNVYFSNTAQSQSSLKITQNTIDTGF